MGTSLKWEYEPAAGERLARSIIFDMSCICLIILKILDTLHFVFTKPLKKSPPLVFVGVF